MTYSNSSHLIPKIFEDKLHISYAIVHLYKKIIHCFHAASTHITPSYYNKPSLNKIITCKDLPSSSIPTKNEILLHTLTNTLRRERLVPT